jgi:Flp pilus assembly protein TadG
MMRIARLLSRLRRQQDGAMVIETALVAPVLVLMSLGTFQISTIMARQSELESAASEAAAIALASAPDTSAKRITLQQVIMASTGLAASNVTISETYRCNSATTYISNANSCTTGVLSKYIKIAITDTYTPAWVHFGVGSAIRYNVNRYVMYKQQSAN